MIADLVYSTPQILKPKPFVLLKNKDFRSEPYPTGNVITISDPRYNCDYGYHKAGEEPEFSDHTTEEVYVEELAYINPPCVIIHYPEDTINILSQVGLRSWGKCLDVLTWIYNDQSTKCSRLVSYWGCKPDYRKIPREFLTLSSKEVREKISRGEECQGSDWFGCKPINNVHRQKIKNPEDGSKHPCQIPEYVMEHVIKSVVSPGQVVIDPYLGSGTTGKVCQDLGHSFIGYEIKKRFFEIACTRMGL